jgi:hypothetical protein
LTRQRAKDACLTGLKLAQSCGIVPLVYFILGWFITVGGFVFLLFGLKYRLREVFRDFMVAPAAEVGSKSFRIVENNTRWISFKVLILAHLHVNILYDPSSFFDLNQHIVFTTLLLRVCFTYLITNPHKEKQMMNC